MRESAVPQHIIPTLHVIFCHPSRPATLLFQRFTFKCLRFPKVGGSVTRWSSQLSQKPPLFHRNLIWIHQKRSPRSLSLQEAQHSLLLGCPLFHYRNRALHTKIKWWGKHIFAPVTNVGCMCMGESKRRGGKRSKKRKNKEETEKP